MVRNRRCPQEVLLALFLLLSLPLPAKTPALNQGLSDLAIVDAYDYYLGRLLILRQEQIDFDHGGFKWNQIVHRPGGLEVTTSEAWIALDDKSCTIIDIPSIQGRYYTVQVLNGWGETTANLNERNYPTHPFGKFALCLATSKAPLPEGSLRINLPNAKSRVIARIELGKNPQTTLQVQKQIKISSTGKPKVSASPKIARFSTSQLPGVEVFTNAQQILISDPDLNEGMANLQANVMAISRAIADSKEKVRINEVIHQQAIPEFLRSAEDLVTTGHGWHRPLVAGNYGSDYRSRTAANFTGLGTNSKNEVLSFRTNTDGIGALLNGSEHYTMTFAKSELPKDLARYLWSITAVDAISLQVIPNLLKRASLNSYSRLKYNKDGSLTLVFANRLPISMPDSNWIPTPLGENYRLTFRYYGPSEKALSSSYFPPPLIKQTSVISLNRLY